MHHTVLQKFIFNLNSYLLVTAEELYYAKIGLFQTVYYFTDLNFKLNYTLEQSTNSHKLNQFVTYVSFIAITEWHLLSTMMLKINIKT